MSRKLSTEEFIEKARKIHGELYDYSKVLYKDNKTKILIIDPEYGEFWQTPNSHMKGRGNRKRGVSLSSEKQKSNTEEFITKAKEVHGDLYDYSKVQYVNAHTKVLIIDPEHGEFWQSPNKHLLGQENQKRAGNLQLTTEEFIEKAQKIHGELYNYSKVVYKNADTKVLIIDPEHGEFWQTPNSHLSGHGNQKRNGINQTFAYIHVVLDGTLPIALKFGIESTKGTRHKQQNRTCIFEVQELRTYKFSTVEDCKEAEQECKTLFGNGILTKEEMPDGFTETTGTENLYKIAEIYEKYGAVKI